MPAPQLFTYKDLIDHLVDYIGSNASKEAVRDARRAAQDGCRELASAHSWSYYMQRGRIVTSDDYTTGTLAYDHTGGAYERMVTLTTGTWPSWAALGQLVIDNVVYQVAERKSDSIITLTYAHNPGEDVAAGETYTLYRDSYPMPSDFQAAGDFLNAANSLWLHYVEPNEWMKRQRVYHGVASPCMYTFTSDENYMGSMAVRFFPPPDDDYPMDFLYKRRPRQLYYDEYSTGTATNTAASTTVTGTGTSWTDRMIGSVLRLSASTTVAPTGLAGGNPYDVERVITAVASTTSLTVDASITDAHSAVKYAISDPVDVEDGSMLTALLRCCEKQSVIIRHMKNANVAGPAYRDALIQARESDSRYMGRRVAGGMPNGYRLADMPAGSDQGT